MVVKRARWIGRERDDGGFEGLTIEEERVVLGEVVALLRGVGETVEVER